MLRSVAVAITLAGCSLATVRGPRSIDSPPRCTRSARLPIAADIGLVLLGAGAAGTAGTDYDTGGRKTIDAIGIGVGISVVIVATVSAIVGYRRADSCRQAWDAFEAGNR